MTQPPARQNIEPRSTADDTIAKTVAVCPAFDLVRAEAHERWRDGRDGDLMLVFCHDDGTPILTLDVDEGTRHVDELFLRHVTGLVDDLRLPAVVPVVLRRDGRPLRSDRRLWHELRHRLADRATALAGFLVVGDTAWWSAAPAAAGPMLDAA